MAREVFTVSSASSDNANVWSGLKRAIATSSGFQRWKLERAVDNSDQTPLDQLIRLYLRETLETLAY
jgi:hypothetical protein